MSIMTAPNPFFIKPDDDDQNVSFNDHFSALEQGSLGKFLAQLARSRRIEFDHNSKLDKNTRALYEFNAALSKPGRIEFNDNVNASSLGHEIRHAWQHLCLPVALLHPEAAEETVLLQTFLEADARAVDFAVTLQIVHTMRPGHHYAARLINEMDASQKEVCEYNIEKIDEFCTSSQKLAQAMRTIFDLWIARSPYFTHYEEQKEHELSHSAPGILQKLKSRFFYSGRRATPYFSRAAMDKSYPSTLAAALGFTGDDTIENYLTTSHGPNFDSEFYTRVCNFRIENKIDEWKKKILTP